LRKYIEIHGIRKEINRRSRHLQRDPEEIQGDPSEMQGDLGYEIYVRHCESGRRHMEIPQDPGLEIQGRHRKIDRKY
jgi:hypothetical protein